MLLKDIQACAETCKTPGAGICARS